MTNRDDFTEHDLAEMASAVFDGEATAEELQFVNDDPRGAELLASYATLRDNLREVQDPSEDMFAQMRSRAVSSAGSATPDTPPPPTVRPVTDLRTRRTLRALGPRLVGVAAVVIIGVGAMAVANFDRGSSSGDTASSDLARTELDAFAKGATPASGADEMSGASESTDDLAGGGGGDVYLGSFADVGDLQEAYRRRIASLVTTPEPPSSETDGATGANGTPPDQTTPTEAAPAVASCGPRSARATLADQEVVLRAAPDQVDVLDATTCAVIATFVP